MLKKINKEKLINDAKIEFDLLKEELYKGLWSEEGMSATVESNVFDRKIFVKGHSISFDGKKFLYRGQETEIFKEFDILEKEMEENVLKKIDEIEKRANSKNNDKSKLSDIADLLNEKLDLEKASRLAKAVSCMEELNTLEEEIKLAREVGMDKSNLLDLLNEKRSLLKTIREFSDEISNM